VKSPGGSETEKNFKGIRENMLVTTDIRLIELKVLENLTNGIWTDGVCAAPAAGQATALGLSERTYADLLVTLFEDRLLCTRGDGLRRELDTYEREKMVAFRDRFVIFLAVSSVFHSVSVTYRGLRRIDELRDQLRRDRVWSGSAYCLMVGTLSPI